VEQSPSSEANNHSASQEIPRPSWNPKVHYRVHKDPSLLYILSQMHPLHTLPSYFPKIHSNSILSFKPIPSKWSLPFTHSNQNIIWIYYISYPCYISRPCHPPRFDHSNNTSWLVQLWSSSFCSLFQPTVTYSLLGLIPNLLLIWVFPTKIFYSLLDNFTYKLRNYGHRFNLIQVSRLSRRWCFKSRSLGRHVV
jgi:hypothetical protein